MTGNSTAISARLVDNTYSKVTLRLMPFLLTCFVLAFLDRINIGFAQLQMKHDLGLSDTAYGIASSAFFIGYLLFEIPSNLLLQRVGARKTLCRILVLWGMTSSATMLVRTPFELQCVRFLLGVFEAGFTPGVLLYLTYWYPPARQGRVVAIYMAGAVIAGMVAGPVSTKIMVGLDNVLQLRGWQWLFLLEGLPSIVAGIVAYFYLTDRPANAHWLSAEERSIVERNNSAALISNKAVQSHWYEVFKDPQVFLFAFCGFTTQCGSYVIFFWMPQILKGFHDVSITQVGLYSVLPYIGAIVALLLWGRHSDVTLERRWHFCISNMTAVVGFLMVIFNSGNLALTLVGFTLSTAGVMASNGVFWPGVSAAIPPTARAAGIALISSIGSLGGLLSPTLIGVSRDVTGRADTGLYIVMGLVALGGLVMVTLIRIRERPQTLVPAGMDI